MDPHIRSQANRMDNRGNLPLSLAIQRHTGEILVKLVQILLEIGSDPRLKDKKGWNCIEIAQSKEEIEALQLLILWQQRVKRLELPLLWSPIHSNLQQLPDFYMELKWEFDSAIFPLLGGFFPSDVCKLWKLGSELRFDSTFASIRKRRKQSLLLRNPKLLDPFPSAPLLLVNHTNKVLSDIVEPLDAMEINAVIGDLMRFEPQNTHILTKATLKPCRNWMGKEIKCSVSGFETRKCDVKMTVQTDLYEYVVPILPKNEESYFRFERNEPENVSFERKTSILEGKLWLSDSFPIKIAAFLPIFEVLGKGIYSFSRLHDFLNADLMRLIGSHSFPLKLDIPLHLSFHAVLTITRFELAAPSPSLFVPPNYPTNSRRIAQKTLDSPSKRHILRHFLL
jgi:hypothetical protein